MRSRQGLPSISESFPTAGGVDEWLFRQWPDDYRISIDDGSRDRSVLHINHGGMAKRWHGGRDATEDSWRFAGRTHPINTGMIWYHQAPRYPCDLRLIRLDTEQEIVAKKSDAQPINEWLIQGFPFDIYTRRES